MLQCTGRSNGSNSKAWRKLRRALVCSLSFCLLGQSVLYSAAANSQPGASVSTAKSGPAGPAGKRVPPPNVQPITVGKMRFEVVHWGKERGLAQNGGYIAAVDSATAKEIWLLRVYEVKYDKALETDVQDVFIKSMSKKLFRNSLHITDENGRSYSVDIDTRTVKTD